MSRVEPFVLGERMALVEGPIAKFADVRLKASVNSFVALGVGSVNKFFPAEPTNFFTRLLLRADLPLFSKFRLILKPAITTP